MGETARLISSRKQWVGQQLELAGFIYLGMNTFPGNERGEGKGFPAMFKLVALDVG